MPVQLQLPLGEEQLDPDKNVDNGVQEEDKPVDGPEKEHDSLQPSEQRESVVAMILWIILGFEDLRSVFVVYVPRAAAIEGVFQEHAKVHILVVECKYELSVGHRLVHSLIDPSIVYQFL